MSHSDSPLETARLGHVHGPGWTVAARLAEAVLTATASGVHVARESDRWLVAGDGWRAYIFVQPARCTPHETLFTELEAHDVDAVIMGDDRAGTTQATVLGEIRQSLLAFTAEELWEIRNLNPLLRDMDGSKQQSSEAVALVREHALLEKLNMVRTLEELGTVDLKDLCFVAKPDQTAHRQRVVAELRRRGCVVAVDAWRPAVTRFLSARNGRAPVVVVDDGGELILHVASSLPAVCRVTYFETNARGIQRLRDAGLLDRVINLSDSAEKLAANTPIALSGVHAFKAALVHRRQVGERVHVVGYGRVGEQVALGLRANRFDVTVSDPVASRRELATTAGFLAFETPRRALQCHRHRYLLGCSGADAIGIAELALLDCDAVVATLSSNDLSRVSTEARTTPGWSLSAGTSGTTVSAASGTTLLLAHGHAINLHGHEGVPEPDFDAFMALVTRSVVLAAAAER